MKRISIATLLVLALLGLAWAGSGDLFSVGKAGTDYFRVDTSGHVLPGTDDTHDLGSASLEFRNLYVDGTANIDTLSVATLSSAVNASAGLEVVGPFTWDVVTVAETPYTVTSTDIVLAVGHTATAATTINLPAAASSAGRILVIDDSGANAAANNITVDGNASENVDGATTATISTDSASLTIYCDGSAWHSF